MLKMIRIFVRLFGLPRKKVIAYYINHSPDSLKFCFKIFPVKQDKSLKTLFS